MDNDSQIRKTAFLPLSCFKGHQIYVVYFSAINRHGFACGICHTLGTTLTHGSKLLEIAGVNDSPDWTPDKRADLLLGMEVKALHTTCSKKHFIMGVEFSELGQYGFGCIHCKSYSLTVQDRGADLEIRVVREVRKDAPPPRIITEHPAFSRVIH
jgi:hypothetical protein